MPTRSTLLPFCLLLLAGVATSAELSLRGTTDKDVAIYKPGERIEFTVRVCDGETPVAGAKLTWTRTGDDGRTESGEGTATVEGLKVATALDRPGFVRLLVHAVGADGKKLQGYVGGWGANKNGDIFFDGGACVEPEKLQAVAEPKDLDAFWTAARAKLDTVPITADLKELPSANPKVKLFAATIACAGPKPVTGYLTVPVGAKDKSLPGVVQFQGYGVGKHNPPGRLNEGAVFLEINAHGMELGREDAYYQQLQKDLSGYCFKNDENADRERTYYYGMALRVMRALQYVKSRPEWNGKDLHSDGGSQGGLQGLWGASLDGDVTASEIWSPWSCDFGGITLGRQRGWRPDYNAALDTFDPVFLAKRIKAKVHLVANYGDYTCAPSGVWLVYDNIPHDRKSMLVKQGCTHGYEMAHGMQYTISPTGVSDVGARK
jgi:cephalosporin-C deacetylase-like acetyl esterase